MNVKKWKKEQKKRARQRRETHSRRRGRPKIEVTRVFMREAVEIVEESRCSEVMS